MEFSKSLKLKKLYQLTKETDHYGRHGRYESNLVLESYNTRLVIVTSYKINWGDANVSYMYVVRLKIGMSNLWA